MSDYWFTPKTHGYGATPTSWKGWVSVLAFIAVAVAISTAMLWQAGGGGQVAPARVVAWFIAMVALTGGFVWLTKRKTDGAWRWRWGDKD
jgi:hypothetical protein